MQSFKSSLLIEVQSQIQVPSGFLCCVPLYYYYYYYYLVLFKYMFDFVLLMCSFMWF